MKSLSDLISVSIDSRQRFCRMSFIIHVFHYRKGKDTCQMIWGKDARGSTGMPEGFFENRFPVLSFPNIDCLTANDKDFSLRSK